MSLKHSKPSLSKSNKRRCPIISRHQTKTRKLSALVLTRLELLLGSLAARVHSDVRRISRSDEARQRNAALESRIGHYEHNVQEVVGQRSIFDQVGNRFFAKDALFVVYNKRDLNNAR